MTFEQNFLKNKTYIVTGASSGLGRGVAVKIASLGGKVIALGRNQDRLDQTLKQLSGADHIGITGDISSAQTAFETVKSARAQHDSEIDGIFHGAGISKIIPIRLTKEEHIDDIMGASLFGAMGISRAAAGRGLFGDSGGGLVFMSSVAAERGQVGMVAYGATRAALSGLVKNLACEFSSKKIRVNSIIAGAVETEMHAAAVRGMDDKSLKDYENKHLLGFGKVDDIVNAAVFLLGPTGKWITGTSMIVDGGYMAK